MGRAGPVFATYLLVSLAWLGLRGTYAPLFAPFAPFRLALPALAMLLAEMGAVAVGVAGLSLAASASSRSSGRAVLTSLSGTLVLGTLFGLALWLAPRGTVLVSALAGGVALAVGGYRWAARRLRLG